MIFGFYNSLNIKTHLNIKDISIGNTYHHPIFITYCILNEIKKMKNNCKIISLLPVAMLTLKCIAYSDTPMLFDSNSPCYNLKEMERDYVIKDTDFIVTYYTGYSYNNVISPINYLLLFKNPLGDDSTLSGSTSVQFKWTDFREYPIPLYSSTKRLEPVYDSSESIAITAYSSNNSRINNSSSIYLTNSFLALNNSDTTINTGGGAIYNTGRIHSEVGPIEKIKPIYFIGNNTSGNHSEDLFYCAIFPALQ